MVIIVLSKYFCSVWTHLMCISCHFGSANWQPDRPGWLVNQFSLCISWLTPGTIQMPFLGSVRIIMTIVRHDLGSRLMERSMNDDGKYLIRMLISALQMWYKLHGSQRMILHIQGTHSPYSLTGWRLLTQMNSKFFQMFTKSHSGRRHLVC